MQRKKIEIDFSKYRQRIILLVGPNGSGKSSIIGELHPFAYPGNMDVRSGTKLILDGNDGYKEIHIQDGHTVYKIKHFYKNTSRGIQVKSFIMKNDDELNPNGNVTSFNEMVKAELGIEHDYLKLLRLGSNVTNLIEMKTGERKSFTSELLADIDIYNQLYRKVNDDARLLRNMIRSVSDKIDKLNIADKSSLMNEIESIQSDIVGLQSRKEGLQRQLGSIEGSISALIPEGLSQFQQQLDALKEEEMTIVSSIESIQDSLNGVFIVMDVPIDEYMKELTREIQEYSDRILVNDTKVEVLRNRLNALYNDRESVMTNLKYLTSSLEYDQLMTLYLELDEKYKAGSEKFKGRAPKNSRDNMMVILNILQEINKIAYIIYEFSYSAIAKACDVIQAGQDIHSYVNDRITAIDTKLSTMKQDQKIKSVKDNLLILFRPDNCPDDNCPYLYLYDLIFSPKEYDHDGVDSLEKERDEYQEVLSVGKDIEYIFVILRSNQAIINKCDISYLSVSHILDCIRHGQEIYDEEQLVAIVSELEEYEELAQIKTRMLEIKQEISKINNNQATKDSLTESLNKINMEIASIEQEIHRLLELNGQSVRYQNKLKSSMETAEEYKRLLDSRSELQMKLEDVRKAISRKQSIYESIAQYVEQSKLISASIDDTQHSIDGMNKILFDKQLILEQFRQLTKEQSLLSGTFDDISIIRESLSSNRGIPLFYVQLYFRYTTVYVNELLRTVYSDTFTIDDFVINETEFSIPYIKNGIRVNDIVYASQGERSFLSLALSFALITQSIDKYNIMLLDELDGALDKDNRSKFINILEKQMDMIHAEQIFLITHNDAFDMYPVDIIETPL